MLQTSSNSIVGISLDMKQDEMFQSYRHTYRIFSHITRIKKQKNLFKEWGCRVYMHIFFLSVQLQVWGAGYMQEYTVRILTLLYTSAWNEN